MCHVTSCNNLLSPSRLFSSLSESTIRCLTCIHLLQQRSVVQEKERHQTSPQIVNVDVLQNCRRMRQRCEWLELISEFRVANDEEEEEEEVLNKAEWTRWIKISDLPSLLNETRIFISVLAGIENPQPATHRFRFLEEEQEGKEYILGCVLAFQLITYAAAETAASFVFFLVLSTNEILQKEEDGPLFRYFGRYRVFAASL